MWAAALGIPILNKGMEMASNRHGDDPYKEARLGMDQMFPGTTAWERLGANSGGTAQISSAGMQAKEQRKTATQVASIQAGAQVAASQASANATKYAADTAAGVNRETRLPLGKAGDDLYRLIDASVKWLDNNLFPGLDAGMDVMKQSGRLYKACLEKCNGDHDKAMELFLSKVPRVKVDR